MTLTVGKSKERTKAMLNRIKFLIGALGLGRSHRKGALLTVLILGVSLALAASPQPKMTTFTFQVIPGFNACALGDLEEYDQMAQMTDKERQRYREQKRRKLVASWKMWLTDNCHVAWPEGSSLSVERDNDGAFSNHLPQRITVKNLPDELLKVAQGLENERSARDAELRTTIELDVCIVKAGREALAAVGWDEGIDRLDAGKLLRELRTRRDVFMLYRTRLVTTDGSEATCKSVSTCRYPQDFDVIVPRSSSISVPGSETNRLSSGVVAVEPQNFETEEVGFTITALPSLLESGWISCSTFALRLRDEPTWKDFGLTLPSPGGGTYHLPMEQPMSHEPFGIDTSLTLFPGKTHVAGEIFMKDGDTTLLVFVTPRIPATSKRRAKKKSGEPHEKETP